MKIDGVKIPKSSFLSIEKDMGIIVDRICDNERLKRLLYYTTPDAMEKPNLTDDQMYELFKKNIRIVPKLKVDNSVLNYLVSKFDNLQQVFIKQEDYYNDRVIEED